MVLLWPKTFQPIVLCLYEDKPCSGARIEILLKNKVFRATSLTSGAQFVIPGLKKHEDYELLLTWEKHKLVDKRKVSAGDYIELNLKPVQP